MTKEEALKELARRELARRRLLDFILYNFPTYKTNWHHRKIVGALEAVERGEIKRLMILMPPRHGKSEICSIQFPAWYLGKHPENEIIAVSYNAELAVDFGKKTRNLVRSREFGNVFPNIRLAEDSKAAGKWNTNEGGSYIATGVGGALTGRGAEVLLIDDPVKNREEAESEITQESIWSWYRSTARTRLNPGGAIILIQTRWHESDLAGKILEEDAKKEVPEWTVIKFPAIAEEHEEFRGVGEALWPEQYPLEELKATESDLGPYDFSSLYQQEPVDIASQEFKEMWFKPVPQITVDQMAMTNYLTVDTAVSQKSSADFTAFCDNSVNKENYWYLKTWKARISPHQLIETLFNLQVVRHYSKVGVEKTVYLDALKPFIDAEQRKRGIFLPIVELKHAGTAKEVRIRGLIPRYSSGSIYHIEGQCEDLEKELLLFPKGKWDDCADAAAYQLQLADVATKKGVSIFRPKFISRLRYS